MTWDLRHVPPPASAGGGGFAGGEEGGGGGGGPPEAQLVVVVADVAVAVVPRALPMRPFNFRFQRMTLEIADRTLRRAPSRSR